MLRNARIIKPAEQNGAGLQRQGDKMSPEEMLEMFDSIWRVTHAEMKVKQAQATKLRAALVALVENHKD